MVVAAAGAGTEVRSQYLIGQPRLDATSKFVGLNSDY